MRGEYLAGYVRDNKEGVATLGEGKKREGLTFWGWQG